MHKKWHYYFPWSQKHDFQRNSLFKVMIMTHFNLKSVSVVTGQELFLAVSYNKPALAARINDDDKYKILYKVGKIQIYHT